MIATAPIPTAAPKPAPTGPAAPTSPSVPTGPAIPTKVDDAAAPTAAPVPTAPPAGQAADGAKPQAPAPSGGAAPADAAAAAAAAKAAVIEKLQSTSAVDAIAQVDAQLGKLATLSVGGGTPEGAESAKVASALLTDSSMMLQHAHVKAMEKIRDMATELQMRVMSSVAGLAYMGGQVAIAGQSKTPVKLADIAAGPITETKSTMADVIEAIMPKADAPKADAPKAEPVPVPKAPNGNTGVAGGMQHVTPGPGAGRGPNPA